MKLHPAQSKVAASRKRFRVLDAGRRFGKTELSAEEITGCAVADDDNNCAYVGPTFQQARDVAWLALKKRLAAATVSVNDSRLEIIVRTVKGGTSRVVLRSWDAIETLRGQFFKLVVLDEVAMYRNFWSGWEEVIRPTLTDKRGSALFISTPKGFNHFYDLFNKRESDPESWESFRFTTYDNPHIPKEEIDEARAQLPEDTFAQEYLADFRKAQGLVYPEFDRARHVRRIDFTPDQVASRLAGVDFGFTNPTAALEIVELADGTIYVASEWYKTGKTNAEVIEWVRGWRPHAVYPDPAEPDRIEEMRRAGLPVRDVRKDVTWGIGRVREAVISGRLVVDPSCQNLLEEIGTYRWREGRDGQNQPDEPEKHHDHALDALRYAVAMRESSAAPLEQDVSIYSSDWG